MDRIAMNNDIVKMRHAVRKARVALASKLIREIKLMNSRKRGNEHLIEKNKRKVDKLLGEVKILKKLKDDDVSRFGIINVRNLREVLVDPSVDARTRVMTKLTFQKHLKDSIDKFKETFPNYQIYFNSEQYTTDRKNKQHRTKDVARPNQIQRNTSDIKSSMAMDAHVHKESCNNLSNRNRSDGTVIDSEKSSAIVSKTETTWGNIKVVRDLPEDEEIETLDSKPKESSIVKIVSKLGTVKRFYVADNIMQNIGMIDPTVNDVESQKDVRSDEEIDVFSTDKNIDNGNSLMAVITDSRNVIDRNDGIFTTSVCHGSMRNSRSSLKARFKHDEFPQKHAKYRNKLLNPADRSSRNVTNVRFKVNCIESTGTSHRDEQTKRSSNELHPSWAARKKQQDILKQGFQGKKIVFNDD